MKVVCWLLLGTALNLIGAETGRLTSAEWNNKGSTYYAANAYGEAERCFQKARQLAIEEREAGAGELPTIVFNLAAVYRAEARYREAEALYFRALVLGQKQENWEERRVARVWNGLTLLYLAEGDLAKAERAARRALAAGEGGDQASRENLDAMNNLARILVDSHRYSEAEQLARKVLAVRSGPTQPMNLQIGTAYQTLGRISFQEARYGAAEEYLERAVPLITHAAGPQSAAAA
jgi:tetratricopeptide (TPR) repeat protein